MRGRMPPPLLLPLLLPLPPRLFRLLRQEPAVKEKNPFDGLYDCLNPECNLQTAVGDGTGRNHHANRPYPCKETKTERTTVVTTQHRTIKGVG